MLRRLPLVLSIAALLLCPIAFARDVNYDESKVPDYHLPDPLVTESGGRVTTRGEWQKRRCELIRMFEQHVYGSMPPSMPLDHFTLVHEDAEALDGQAILREVNLYFDSAESSPVIRLLMFVPKDREAGPVPAFVGYNFKGNHTVSDAASVRLQPVWGRQGNRAAPDESERGASSSRWPVREIVQRGYALVTAHYADVDPDFHDGFENGVHPLFTEYQNRGDNWASIGAWAWGLSRVVDYLETVDEVDAERIAVIGHSRLGKTALWAGATDERFAMVVSNNSGCGGAALARRQFGETVAIINRSFPHWFCENHKQYGDNVEQLPVDQHQLIALIAPRPVYVASATEDRWADPRGEFLACLAADPVYKLLGTKGLPTDQWPAADSPIHGQMGYHLRTGKHGITTYDWKQYLDFADRHLKRAETTSETE